MKFSVSPTTPAMKKKQFSSSGKLKFQTVLLIVLGVLFLFYIISLRHASWSKPYVLVVDPPFQKEEVLESLKEARSTNPMIFIPITKEGMGSHAVHNLLCSMDLTSPGAIHHSMLLGVDEKVPQSLLRAFSGIQAFNSDKYWKISTAELPHGKNITGLRKRLFHLIKRNFFLLKALENTNSNIVWSDSHSAWLGDILGYVQSHLNSCDVLFSDGEYWPLPSINHFILPIFDPTFFVVKNSHSGKKMMKVWLGKLLEDWRESRYPKEKLVLHEALFQLWSEGNLHIRDFGDDTPEINKEAVNVCFLPRHRFPQHNKAREAGFKKEKEVLLLQPLHHSQVERNIFMSENIWFYDEEKGCHDMRPKK